LLGSPDAIEWFSPHAGGGNPAVLAILSMLRLSARASLALASRPRRLSMSFMRHAGLRGLLLVSPVFGMLQFDDDAVIQGFGR
jgi:hypothetical protein